LFTADIPTKNNNIFSKEMLSQLANSRDDCYLEGNRLIMKHNISENEYKQLMGK
jgi:hypothetical protein